jgi:hypothetical protein
MRELAWITSPATLQRLRAVLLYGDKFVTPAPPTAWQFGHIVRFVNPSMRRR